MVRYTWDINAFTVPLQGFAPGYPPLSLGPSGLTLGRRDSASARSLVIWA